MERQQDLPNDIYVVPDDPTSEIHRAIDGHARHSGGVHARWLSRELDKTSAEITSNLQALGYRAVSEVWWVPSIVNVHCELGQDDVLHRGLRKMFQSCGPLPIDDICSGIRNVVSRTRYPVPPPRVMSTILRMYGYTCADGLWYWDGAVDSELSAGERAVLGCLRQHGPVVHHTQLVQAFHDTGLSFSQLYPTLSRSPLFERLDTGLYKLRGKPVGQQDIARARAAGEPTPVKAEITYSRTGTITVTAGLSAHALATGTILCHQFPNLTGEWACYVCGKRSGDLEATAHRFRHLGPAFKALACRAGDRVQFTFNTWERTVTVEKAGD